MLMNEKNLTFKFIGNDVLFHTSLRASIE